jgi:phage antirepressor YoqD-like protein
MNIIQSNIKLMSSEDLYYVVCDSRATAGESRPRYSDFSARLIDELEGEHYESFAVQNPNNTKTTYHWLNNDQCVLVGMRESKAVRRQVLKKLKELSQLEASQVPLIPQNFAQALQLAADQAKQLEIAAPKLEYHDKVLASTNGLTTTEIASEFNMSAIKLNRLFCDLKVQRKIGGRWVLTAAMLGQGLTTETTFIDDKGVSRHSMKWTEKGRKLIHELMD